MNTQKRIFLVLALLVLSLSVCFGVYQVQASSTAALSADDQQQIKQMINNYFEARYQSFQSFQLSNFDTVIVSNRDMQKELDKLDLMIYQRQLYHLKYQQYQVYVDFGDIRFDPGSATARVNVTEGSDVLFENSSPTPTKMRDLEHLIILQKGKGGWKITSDQYEDDYWRMLKNTNLSKAELKTMVENSAKQDVIRTGNLKSDQSVATLNVDTCTVRGVNVCYDRANAVTYANNHFNKDIANPNYVYVDGNDCTNFVSQAITLGGGISQYLSQAAIDHRSQWHYENGYPVGDIEDGFYYYPFQIYWNGTLLPLYNRSTSWFGVDQLNAFLVPGPTEVHYRYLGGPIASSREFQQTNHLTDIGDLQLGDIIQFDWVTCTQNCNSVYDHSAIVTEIHWNSSFGRYDVSVDAHSDDIYYRSIYDMPPWQRVRFIHIADRLQQTSIFLPGIYGGSYPTAPNVAGATAYPAPGQPSDSNNPSSGIGYPAPGQDNIASPDKSYPAP